MRIGVFGDVHDHIDHMRLAIRKFNELQCELILFAGDFVSPIVVPPLRKLHAPFIGCFGDSDGNKIGIQGGMKIIGPGGEPPYGFTTKDGTHVLLTHELDCLKGLLGSAQLIISSHTHRPSIVKDATGRLFVNPGETSGWTSRKSTIAIVETDPLNAEIITLAELPPPPAIE